MRSLHTAILISTCIAIVLSLGHSQDLSTGAHSFSNTRKPTEREKAEAAYLRARADAIEKPDDLNLKVKLHNAKHRLDSIDAAQKKIDSVLIARSDSVLSVQSLEKNKSKLKNIFFRDPQRFDPYYLEYFFSIANNAKTLNDIKKANLLVVFYDSIYYPKNQELIRILKQIEFDFRRDIRDPNMPYKYVLERLIKAMSDRGYPKYRIDNFIKSLTPTTVQQVLSTATGTGETTGKIADIRAVNNNNYSVQLLPQTFYIYSNGKDQSYGAWILDPITIPPGGTAIIPVYGYCADVRKPPVASGEAMIPVSEWIPVGDLEFPEDSDGGVPVTLNDRSPLTYFKPEDIPSITGSGIFQSKPSKDSSIIITWPGTDIPVNGYFSPEEKPEVIAPVIISALESIENAAAVIITSGEYKTPFSSNPELEYSSFVQQTFWMTTSGFFGNEYKEEEFAENVYTQFESNTQTTVSSLPPEQKQELDKGIKQFWGGFTATGLKAKVIKNPDQTEPPVLISEPVKSPCSLIEEIRDSGEKLDYAIANTGTKSSNEKVKEAFEKAIREAAEIQSNLTGNDTIGVDFTTPEMPASAWSLYFPHTVAGRANASAATINIKDPLHSSFTTEPLVAKANGEHTVTLTHQLGDHCKSTLVGVNLGKVRANSTLNASLSHIEVLRVINFIGEVAIDILIKRGKGTLKKLSTYFKDKIKDMAKAQAKEFITEELNKLADQLQGKSDEEIEKTMDELIGDIKSGKPDEGEEEADEQDEFMGLMADVLIEGAEFDPVDKMTGDLIDKIDSPIDWSPIQTNTYAIAEGSLEVFVDEVKALAKSGSGVSYKRKGLEDKAEAEKGGGVYCKQALASKTTSGKITAKTLGKAETRAGATGGGIISTGHGIATATLESFNGIYIIAICDCPDGVFYEKYISTTGFSIESDMTSVWSRVFANMLDDVYDSLAEDSKKFPSFGPTKVPRDYPQKLQKKMETAAAQSGQIILSCKDNKK